MKQMLSALIYLHEGSIIHRDIKLDNILHDGESNFYLADFGLSKIEDMSNTLVGSLEFIAPETFQLGPQTTKMDIWGLGVVVLCALDIVPEYHLTWEELKSGAQGWFQTVVSCVNEHVPEILPMFEMSPWRRYSARNCLAKLFDSELKIRSMPKKQSNLQQPGGQARAESRERTDMLPQGRRTMTVKVGSARSRATQDPGATPAQQRGTVTAEVVTARSRATQDPGASPAQQRGTVTAEVVTARSRATQEPRAEPAPRRRIVRANVNISPSVSAASTTSTDLMFPLDDFPSSMPRRTTLTEPQRPQTGAGAQAESAATSSADPQGSRLRSQAQQQQGQRSLETNLLAFHTDVADRQRAQRLSQLQARASLQTAQQAQSQTQPQRQQQWDQSLREAQTRQVLPAQLGSLNLLQLRGRGSGGSPAQPPALGSFRLARQRDHPPREESARQTPQTQPTASNIEGSLAVQRGEPICRANLQAAERASPSLEPPATSQSEGLAESRRTRRARLEANQPALRPALQLQQAQQQLHQQVLPQAQPQQDVDQPLQGITARQQGQPQRGQPLLGTPTRREDQQQQRSRLRSLQRSLEEQS